MNIEEEIFKRTHVNFNKLEIYGFIKDQDCYKYSQIFLNNTFRADVIIDQNGNISGKVFDLLVEEEYINFRIINHRGEFVQKVREEYKNILKDIRNHCFEKNDFIFSQTNRIAHYIYNTYADQPCFLWEKYPGYGVFKNKNNDKWYGIIMNIDRSKIDKDANGEIEIIDVKVDANEVDSYLKQEGFYLAYHMNKKNWLTLVLDDTIPDEIIHQFIDRSYQLVNEPTEWIVPANPNYYDMIHCFDHKDIMEWKQSSDIHIGDIVYMYVGAPYSAILYKCKAVAVKIPYSYKDDNISMSYIMRIQLLERYDPTKIPFSKLKELGIRAIRGPRKIKKEISKKF